MLHRAKSKDRVPSGPSYFSKEQMGDYLKDLRENRPQRPSGARPLPSAFLSQRKSLSHLQYSQPTKIGAEEPAYVGDTPTPPGGQVAQRQSSMATMGSQRGRPLARQPEDTPTVEDDLEGPITGDKYIPYVENGARWMEKQEAHSLRKALEDMDLREEKRIHEAAQKEASDLVWKHRNPDAPYRNPDVPHPYTAHLRKGSHSRSPSWVRAQDLQQSMSKRRGNSTSRSASGGTATNSSASSRVPSDSSLKVPGSPDFPSEEDSIVNQIEKKTAIRFVEPTQGIDGPNQTSLSKAEPSLNRKVSEEKRGQPDPKSEQATGKQPWHLKNSVTNRKTSGSRDPANNGEPKGSNALVSSTITNNALPHHLKNPFARLRSVKSSPSVNNSKIGPINGMDRFNRVEIQKNPPSQSRNPQYLTNPAATPVPGNVADGEEVKMKDGKEIRSDDIRKATSMSLKDRSPKLHTPSMVSDNPGRPIVSFDPEWKPKEAQLKEEISSLPPIHMPQPYPSSKSKQQKAPFEVYQDETATQPRQPMPIEKPEPTRNSVPPASSKAREPSAPASPLPSTGPSQIPSIDVTDACIPSGSGVANCIPTISFNDEPPIPTIAVSDTPSIPTITVDATPSIPSISIDAPASSVSNPPRTAPPTRPLPSPTNARPASTHAAQTAPNQKFYKGSPTPPSASSGGALCSACALPIAGRTVTAAGSRFHPSCFRCCVCAEGLECVAFYPEPEPHRLERASRIHARQRGELRLEHEQPGKTEREDGWDDGLRFYCHLDYHELFSPRCKSCKTPIEGEVVVACGAEWHVGHFFCAQCGDPFDSTTPFVEKDGYAWCVDCHTNRYSPKCKKCRKPVTDMVVKALGAEWHEHCFVCTECVGPFVDGRYFLRPGRETEPVCPKCEERRLKA